MQSKGDFAESEWRASTKRVFAEEKKNWDVVGLTKAKKELKKRC